MVQQWAISFVFSLTKVEWAFCYLHSLLPGIYCEPSIQSSCLWYYFPVDLVEVKHNLQDVADLLAVVLQLGFLSDSESAISRSNCLQQQCSSAVCSRAVSAGKPPVSWLQGAHANCSAKHHSQAASKMFLEKAFISCKGCLCEIDM